MKISIYRYLPEEDEAPRMQDYTLELNPGEDMMLLDVLERLKEQDPSLTYRRSCRDESPLLYRRRFDLSQYAYCSVEQNWPQEISPQQSCGDSLTPTPHVALHQFLTCC